MKQATYSCTAHNTFKEKHGRKQFFISVNFMRAKSFFRFLLALCCLLLGLFSKRALDKCCFAVHFYVCSHFDCRCVFLLLLFVVSVCCERQCWTELNSISVKMFLSAAVARWRNEMNHSPPPVLFCEKAWKFSYILPIFPFSFEAQHIFLGTAN